MPSDEYIVETWLKGWSLSRNLPLPVKVDGGLRVDVGWPGQQTRYVFPKLTDDFKQLANRIVEPQIFLKICARPHEMINILPTRWIMQPQGFMMTCFQSMKINQSPPDSRYTWNVRETGAVSTVSAFTADGNIAAMGHLILVENMAIYDRIITESAHRRKGLATAMMSTMENIALSRGITKGVLVATAEGKVLYERLGWELYSYYTSFVIPGKID